MSGGSFYFECDLIPDLFLHLYANLTVTAETTGRRKRIVLSYVNILVLCL